MSHPTSAAQGNLKCRHREASITPVRREAVAISISHKTHVAVVRAIALLTDVGYGR
jgi:hypothetical protein